MRVVLRSIAVLTAAALFACGGDDTPASPTAAQSTSPTATRTVTVPGVASDTPTTAAPTPTPRPGPPVLALQPVADGFERPTFVTHAGDGSGRLFVLEKAGRIRIIEAGGTVVAEPFLDIEDLVTDSGNEQGLLGLAFHPEYPDVPLFYIAYTAEADGANTLAQLTLSSDPNLADRGSLLVLLAIPDSRSNHNGGMVAFGPDGYLYLSTGDGGGGGDPDLAGQRLDTLAGKILRIDVNGDTGYEIPADNPFAGDTAARGEIWAYGLRNPWRFSFDRETGDLWIADVGQNMWEEVNFQPAGSAGGENYGWSIMEGAHCFRPASGCDTSGKVLPVYEYDHGGGCSVTGGYVYRGEAIPALGGLYLFTDYCAGVFVLLERTGETAIAAAAGIELGTVSSFGEDESGELYAVSDNGGAIHRIINRSD